MSKSYFEWELSFRKKRAQPRSSYSKRSKGYLHKEVNSLGIPKKEFKEFMENWKTKNL
jgi:hypothetical protein